ncbi:3-oxoacyl-[acyl-carrier-protein] synthase 2 [Candidatus Rubidus massiliensis]|nr:3-oxoacyl-[acyl-carrier-protein] synthase 2 [Candidatus Rubidus massiliensis]
MGKVNRTDMQRVVVTGMGIVSTLGEDLLTYFNALKEGKSNISRWKEMDERCLSKIGGDMTDFDPKKHFSTYKDFYPEEYINKALRLFRPTPLAGKLTATACLQAFIDSGLHLIDFDPYRFAHMLGGHNLNCQFIQKNVLTYEEEPEYIDPLFGLVAVDTDILALSNEIVNSRGPGQTTGGACASSNIALVQGLDIIRSGRADIVLVSGAASALDHVSLQGWGMMDALTFKSFNDNPQKASRPFDKKREGFIPAESAGAVILESLEHAKKRKAKIYAEVLGGAYTTDACRLSKPHLDGQIKTMQLALQDAGIDYNKIDYVNAHATSTPLGDQIEIQALKQVLQERIYQIPINSTKSMLGHCLTAASLVEFIASVLQMQHSFVHPTINQEEKDEEFEGLDLVPNKGREHIINFFLSNAFGFGGINSSIIAGKYDG